MSAGKPLWLRAVLKVERAVGVSRRGLHLLNLPAGTDVRRVREQLSRLERRLDQLSYDVADLDEDDRPQPRSQVQ